MADDMWYVQNVFIVQYCVFSQSKRMYTITVMKNITFEPAVL